MAKMVGLTRKLRLPWLNWTAALAEAGLPEEEARERLHEYLRFEIDSPTTLRKTREILLQAWIYENETLRRLRSDGLALIRESPEYAPMVHWCVLLAMYPVFADLCKIIGNLAEFQGEVTAKQIRSHLYDEWGERTTIFYSAEKLISSMKDWRILESDRPGRYQILKGPAANNRAAVFMIYAFMLAVPRAYYSMNDLNHVPYFFPFPYRIGKEILQEDSHFSLNYFGDELTVSLRNR